MGCLLLGAEFVFGVLMGRGGGGSHGMSESAVEGARNAERNKDVYDQKGRRRRKGVCGREVKQKQEAGVMEPGDVTSGSDRRGLQLHSRMRVAQASGYAGPTSFPLHIARKMGQRHGRTRPTPAPYGDSFDDISC